MLVITFDWVITVLKGEVIMPAALGPIAPGAPGGIIWGRARTARVAAARTRVSLKRDMSMFLVGLVGCVCGWGPGKLNDLEGVFIHLVAAFAHGLQEE